MPGAWHINRQPPQGLAPSGVEGAPGQHTARAGPFMAHGTQPQTTTQQQQATPAWTGAGAAATSSEGGWWDDIFGQGTGQFGGVTAPTISAPRVKAPEIPQTPSVTPGYYTDALPSERPESDIERMINEFLGQEVGAPPEMQVDADFVNSIIQQFGIEPRTPEDIQEHAQAIVDRQRYSQEQIIQREIERFERDFPNEFRKAEQQIRDAAANVSADRQEEMAARGTFYSSIMAQSMAEIDSETMEMINDIATSAASHVTGLRGEMRDLQQWAVLEEEVVRRQLEAEDRQQRERLAMMHIEVATWADQMALDTWYRQESLSLQQDQLQLQGLQLKQQEAERMGQHYATAMMADHPLVQGTLQAMGVNPEAYAQMPMEQQSFMVNNIIGYNEIEQQMRMREFQMSAAVAEIQLQNASMQLQAQIASGQLQMDAQRLNLQYMMHRDQMALSWAGHSLDERALDWQMSQPIGGTGVAQPQQFGVNQMVDAAARGDVSALRLFEQRAMESGDTGAAQLARQYINQIGQLGQPEQQQAAPQASQPFFGPGGTAEQLEAGQGSWLSNLFGGGHDVPHIGPYTRY